MYRVAKTDLDKTGGQRFLSIFTSTLHIQVGRTRIENAALTGKQGGMHKNPAMGGMLGLPYFVTGIGCDTGQLENCPSLALRPKLPATADQREGDERPPVVPKSSANRI